MLKSCWGFISDCCLMLRCKNADAESITCCIGIFDVAKEKQAQDFDSYHICMCRNCGNNAFHLKVCLFFFLHYIHIQTRVALSFVLTFTIKFELAFKLSSILILGYAEINEFVECWCSYLRRGLGWHLPEVVGFQLFTSLAMALISWQLFSACQRPSA